MRADETREEAIVRLKLQNGFTNQQLVDLGFSKTKITSVLNSYRIHNCIIKPNPIGRPKKVSPEIAIRIESETIQKPRCSIEEIRNIIKSEFSTEISAGTISKIRGDLHFRYKPPKIVQNLTEAHILKRIKFAYTLLQSDCDLANIIFSDEVRVSLGPDNRLLWRRYGQDNPDIFIERSKSPPVVLFIGCIGNNYKGELIKVMIRKRFGGSPLFHVL